MGIFSFLNQKQSHEPEDPDDMPPASQAEKKTRAELPDLHKEMPVEILGENGQVTINGIIIERDGQEITIGRCPGGLSFQLCETGSSVIVRGRDCKMAQFNLRAIVAESSRIHIRLKDLVQEVRNNLRSAFRLTVNTPISVFYYDDKYMQLPEKCILMDISTGGCCISSDQLYKEGEVLRLRIKLENYVPMNLVGEVIRVTERGYKEYIYGILFAQLKKEETDALTRTLYNLQMGNREEHSRASVHW